MLMVLLLVGFVTAGYSATLYKWIDEDGNVVYQDTPPPASTNFEEQSYVDEGGLENDIFGVIEEAAEDNPISFYSITDCEACDLVRLFLENLSLPFSEKDIENNLTTQQELQGLTGQLRVPTLAVGEEVIDGYSKQGIRRVLREGGYPVDEIEAGSLESAESTEGQDDQQGEQGEVDIEQAAVDEAAEEIVDPENFNFDQLYDQLKESSSSNNPVIEIEGGDGSSQ